MSHNDEFETLAAVHAVGALDGDDLVRLEAHLADGCAECEGVLRESGEALAREALGGVRAIPPAHVRQQLLARLEQTAPRPLPRARSWLPRAAGIAAVFLAGAALSAGFVAARYETKLGVMAREMKAVKDRVALQETTLREQLRVYANVVDLLRDPGTRVIAMQGAGPNPQAIGRVVWNESTGGHVFVANLPAPPEGKTYELWTIAGGTPKPAGLFATDASGKGSAPVPAAGKVDVFAVTLEPAGGVPAPTGPIVLASAK
jgi:anti-sigma-K factor RskA